MTALPSRTLHLIDLTFLAATMKSPYRTPWSDLSEVDHLEALDAYRHSAKVQRADHLVVGVHSNTAAQIGWVLPSGVAMRCTTGRDAGVRALLSVIDDPAQVARSYQMTAIGSGRSDFAAVAERIRAAGSAVAVVAPPSAPSALLFAADRVISFQWHSCRRHRNTASGSCNVSASCAGSRSDRPSSQRAAA